MTTCTEGLALKAGESCKCSLALTAEVCESHSTDPRCEEDTRPGVGNVGLQLSQTVGVCGNFFHTETGITCEFRDGSRGAHLTRWESGFETGLECPAQERPPCFSEASGVGRQCGSENVLCYDDCSCSAFGEQGRWAGGKNKYCLLGR